jgi:hypothetical protein
MLPKIKGIVPRFVRPSSKSGTYRFPYERQDDYVGTITFRPIKYTPPEISGGGIKALLSRSTGNGGLSQFANGDIGSAAAFFEGYEAAQNRLYDNGIRTDRAPPSLPTNTNISQDPNGRASKSVTDRTRGVILYLPTALQFDDTVSYNEASLGTIGAIGLAGIQSGAGAFNSLARGLGEVTGSMASLLKGNVANQRGARLAATRLAEVAPIGESGAAAVKAGLGATVNPNTINLFKSVNLREFRFQFKLIASSQAEAIQIKNIVEFFRTTMYPNTINFDDGAGGLNVPIGYEFPDKFEITMKYNNNNVATKILPSVLKTVSTTYNPGSMGWHVEGYASEVDITLTFGEERTLSRKDIINGY